MKSKRAIVELLIETFAHEYPLSIFCVNNKGKSRKTTWTSIVAPKVIPKEIFNSSKSDCEVEATIYKRFIEKYWKSSRVSSIDWNDMISVKIIKHISFSSCAYLACSFLSSFNHFYLKIRNKLFCELLNLYQSSIEFLCC